VYAQVLQRTAMLALLFATQWWWAAVYLGGDFLLFVVYKCARHDVLYWPPASGVPLSLLGRFNVKFFTDSTACVHFRHPLELGGLYYTLNAVMSQAIAPFAQCRRRASSLFRPCRTRGSDPCVRCS
jgi:hypothetical protein